MNFQVKIRSLKDTQLVDEERICLAIDFMKHEYAKILPKHMMEIMKHLNDFHPNKSSNNITIRNFWNLFAAVSNCYWLKLLTKDVTAKNYQWQRYPISLEQLYPETLHGWMEVIKNKDSKFSLKNALKYFQKNPNKLKEARERSNEIAINRHENDAKDPLIGVAAADNKICIKDGNRRLMSKIEDVASENGTGSDVTMDVWVGTAIDNEAPKDYWIPTSTLMEIIETFKWKEQLEKELQNKFPLAYFEYEIPLKKFVNK